MSFGIIGGAVIGGGLGLLAAKKAGQSQERAAKTQARASIAAQDQALQLQREQLEATAPLRQLALEQGQLSLGTQREILPLLRKDFTSGSALSPFFKQQLERGTRSTISALAPFGLEDSTVAGRAVGELGANLGTQELLARRNLGLSLAGINPVPGGFGTAGLGTSAQLGLGAAGFGLQAGQSTAAGQLGAGQSQANALAGLGGLLQPAIQKLFSGTGVKVQSGPTIPSNVALSL